MLDISIHAPREGGDVTISWGNGILYDISIHAPREGGDAAETIMQQQNSISIHAPREGGDLAQLSAANSARRFQSTPPARGATTPKQVRPT